MLRPLQLAKYAQSTSQPISRTFSHPMILIPHLIITTTPLRKLKNHTASSQPLINLTISIKSMIYTTLLLLVQNDLQNTTAIFLGAYTLADNIHGIHEIGEDGVVHGGEGTGPGSFLLLRGARTVGTLWTGEDSTRGEN